MCMHYMKFLGVYQNLIDHATVWLSYFVKKKKKKKKKNILWDSNLGYLGQRSSA